MPERNTEKPNSRITRDPITGRLMLDGQVLDRHDPRLWGRSGRPITTYAMIDAAAQGSLAPENYDPRYFEAYTIEGSEGAGGSTAYRLRPEIVERLRGRVQLTQSGTWGGGEGEGWNEVIDPSLVEYDEELGFITDPRNIRPMDPQAERQAAMRGAVAMTAFGAAGLGAAGSDLAANLGLTGGAPPSGYMGDPYTLDPGFFGPDGTPIAGPATGYMGDPYTLDPGFFGPDGTPVGSDVTAPTNFDDFVDQYLNRFDGDALPEGWADGLPSPDAPPPGYLGDPYTLDPGFFNADGTPVAGDWWDMLTSGATSLGSRLIDRLPQIAGALRPLAQGGPGSGGPRGSLSAPSADVVRASSGSGGFGGGGGGSGGSARGSALDLEANPYGKMKKLQEVLSLAEYLAGARK